MIAWADRNRPHGWRRLTAPVLGLGLLGAVSIPFPQLLGDGKDVSQLAFTTQMAPVLLLTLLWLKPAAIALCIRCAAPGGLFTPSLTMGALLGAVLGCASSWFWPGVPPGLFAVIVGIATLLARSIEPRSIYDARLTDQEIAARQALRDRPPQVLPVG
jgi:H+/Cl- antiporter ClcA